MDAPTPEQLAELAKAVEVLRAAKVREMKQADIPQTFLGFCEWMGVELSPGQRWLVRVAYDGESDAAPDEPGLGTIFGPAIRPGIRRVVCAVCGARAGKSYILVALRLVWGMLIRKIPALPPGSRAVALIIAPRDSLRQEVFRYALGAVQSKPELAALLDGKPLTDSFRLRRPDGRSVSFETGVATAGGTAARGRWYTDFALDECAFFRDETYSVNDEELFRAGTARLLPGGQGIVASTPWGQSGLLYRLWKERPADTLVAHAPTLLLNDTEVTRAVVADAEQQDPENARREFGAEFMTSGTTLFFESACVDAAIDDEPFEVEPGDIIAAGGDFGFRSDSSALIMVALRRGELHVFDGTEERPDDGQPLKPSRTVAMFAEKIGGRCLFVMADQHYREAIAEHLDEHGLVYAPAPAVPADTYVRARMLLRDARVRIHPLPFRKRLVQQMREVQGRPTSGGGMSIVHPRWAKGGHGDLIAALVLAVWQVSGEEVPADDPPQGTPEWLEEQKEKRRRRHLEGEERPAWKARGEGIDRGAYAHWRVR